MTMPAVGSGPPPVGLLTAPAVEADEVRRTRRWPRDWVIDCLCFLLAVGFTALAYVDGHDRHLGPVPLAVDVILGGLSCLGVWLLKDTRPTEILDAISRVAAGEPILSPAVTRQLIAHVGTTGADARQRHARTMLARLSEREREVAVAVGRGRSNAEISDELFMSVATVKAHVSSMLTKLDLNNRTQVALLAHDAGLTG